jgi:hypothetical protein
MLLVSLMSPLFLVQFQECLMVKLEIMLNIINAKWDKISNGKKYNDTSKKTKKIIILSCPLSTFFPFNIFSLTQRFVHVGVFYSRRYFQSTVFTFRLFS